MARVGARIKPVYLYLLGSFRVAFGQGSAPSKTDKHPFVDRVAFGNPRPPPPPAVPFRLGTRKVEALLAYLALHPGAHAREKLAALCWGEVSDVQARNSLRNALATINRKLDPRLLIVDRECVEINPAFPLWVDAVQLTDGRGTPFTRANAQTLVELYRGDLLADFYDDWIIAERDRLRARYVETLLRLVQDARSCSEYARAIQLARQVLAREPANERAHQHLMFAYVASGNPAAALAQYDECRRALRAELDVEPMPETTALYEWCKRTPSAASSAARITNLPIPISSFIGRQREVTELKKLLAPISSQAITRGAHHNHRANAPYDNLRPPHVSGRVQAAGGVRLLTLTGAGGSGKTRLAIAVATDLLDAFKDGVWWVELSPFSDPWLVPQAVARALGVREAGTQPILQALVQFLAPRQCLLVLDNCEHLLSACAEITEHLLCACPNLTIVATSREALGITGEHNWLVPLLTLPTPDTHLDKLKENDAIRLFVARAHAVKTDFQLTERNAPAAAQICRTLDDIPLAIELAAARVSMLSLNEIAGKLDNCFNLLTMGSRTALPRQQTLRAMIDWSYDLLSPGDALLFRQLAVFTGGRTLDAASHVCTADVSLLNTLNHLVNKSLLYTEERDGTTRYRFLETIRQYAREKLVRSGEAEPLRRRHLDYFLAWAEKAAVELQGGAQVEWTNRLEAEHENLGAALQYALEANAVESGMRLAVALGRFWELRGYASEALRWLQEFLASPVPVPAALRARALYRMGYLQFHLCDYANARVAYRASLALQIEIGDKLGSAQTLGSLAGISWAEQNYRGARELLEQSLVVRREVGSKIGIASALNNLGIVAAFEHDYAAARAYLDESLVINVELGNQWGSADALQNLAELDVLEQKTDDARDHLRRALELYRSLQGKPGIVRTLESLATVAIIEERARIAAQLFGAVEMLRENIHLPLMPSAVEEHARYVERVRAALGQPAFDAAWTEGRALSPDQAIELALTV